jgi:hypothetical protein
MRIFRATKSKPKYRHLMGTLQELNLLTDSGSEHFVPNLDGEIDLLYIQPNNVDGASNVVSFDDVAKSIRLHHADPMSKRFALSLESRRGAEKQS